MTNSPNAVVTYIEPIYVFDTLGGGYFNIIFNNTNKYRLLFKPFVEWLLNQDKKLFDYSMSRFSNSKKTLSDLVQDYYEIGVDIPIKVQEYVDFVMSSVNDSDKLRELQSLIRKLGGNPLK